MNTPNQPRAAGQAAHTPTPWHATDGGRVIYDANGKEIVCCVYRSRSLIEDEANAAFIVRACNNHARLTAENKALREALECLMQGSLFCSYDDQPPCWQRIAMPSEAAMNKARAALANTNTDGR